MEGLGVIASGGTNVGGYCNRDEQDTGKHLVKCESSSDWIDGRNVAVAQGGEGNATEVQRIEERVHLACEAFLQWQEVKDQCEVDSESDIALHCHSDAIRWRKVRALLLFREPAERVAVEGIRHLVDSRPS